VPYRRDSPCDAGRDYVSSIRDSAPSAFRPVDERHGIANERNDARARRTDVGSLIWRRVPVAFT